MEDETTVTIRFPDSAMAKLFIAWLTDGGGYDDGFYSIAANDAGMYTRFEKSPNSNECHVSITGRVVDDDDPDMFGEEE